MDKKIEEAIKRMELLHMNRKCINEFKKGNIWESEGFGALYDLDDEEKEIIKRFEEKYKGCIVYHVIHNRFEFGECYSLLYVPDDESEWEQDINDIKDGYAFVYVYNKDDEWCSEFGTIAIKPSIGGLVRLG